MEITTENLEQAVAMFYQITAGAMQAHSHKWLLEAQNSPQAWSFVWELLRPDKSAEVQFFAATTLHLKIRRAWCEIPVEQYSLLKKQLLEAIANYCLGPKIVLNRLCIALSAYILQTLPTHWPNAISELLATLTPSNLPAIPPERTVWILLQILTVLPEEFRSTDLAQHQKALVRNELGKNAPQVLSLVEELLAANLSHWSNETAYELSHQSALCAAAWLELGVPPTECDRLAEQLLTAVYTLTSAGQPSAGLVDAALTGVSNMLLNPCVHQYPATCLKMIGQLLPLHDIVLHQQQLPRDEQDEDLLLSLYGVLLSVAETHCRLLLNTLLEDNVTSRGHVLRLLDIALQCSNSPGAYPTQETTSPLALGFWFMLQDEMLALEPEQHRTLLPTLTPVYRSLSEVMLSKSMLHDAGDEWSKEDEETLRCYRQDVQDTMLYCYAVLREDLLQLLTSHLEAALAACVADARAWPQLESCLHGFHAVAECVGPEESVHIPRFLDTVQRLPFHSLDARVGASALDAVGACAEWINSHPAVLASVVPLLVMGLGNVDIAPSATMALKDLSRDCQPSLAPFAHHILQASQEALNRGQLRQSEMERLMYIMGRVLAVLPVDTIMSYLTQLLVPCVEQLDQLTRAEASASTNVAVVSRLKMLKTLFGTLDIRTAQSETEGPGTAVGATQPVFIVLQRVLPVLRAVVERWHKVPEITEAVCLTIKHALTTLVEDTRPLLAELLELLLFSYRLQPNPPALLLARQFVVLYAREEPAAMQSLLAELCNSTTAMLVENGPTSLPDGHFITDEILGLLTQVVKKSPALMAAVDVTSAFRCATKALQYQENSSIKAASMFLVHFVTHSREAPALKTVVQTCGEELVVALLRCVGGLSPRASVDHLADVLLALNKKYCDNLARWLQQAVSQDGFLSPRVTRQQSADFAKAVLREHANRRKLQEVVREFSLLCRGLIGTEYALQTATRLLDH